MKRPARILAIASLACCLSAPVVAQESTGAADSNQSHSVPLSSGDDGRVQYPAGLANSYVAIHVGAIGYAFSDRQLEPGHSVGSIEVPHTAAGVVLFGHHFGKYFSLQGSYMRPIKYVRYQNLDGSDATAKVWMHFGMVAAQVRLPINDRWAVFGEGGLGITSRRGFDIGDGVGIKNAHFASVLMGGGIEYRVNRTIDFLVGSTVIPARSQDNNPATIFTSAGVRFNMRPLPPELVAESAAAGFIFPKTIVQGGFATDVVGFSVNHFFSKTVPIFWGGDVKVKRNVASLSVERNLFHTKKIFAVDIGGSYSEMRSQDNDGFRAFSFFPVLRFTFARTKPADVYVSFSQAGPTYISRVVIDGLETGSHFTFQDFMAAGVFLGSRRRLNLELNLNHYSNGNLMSANAGVMVPLAIKLGYAF